MKTTGLLATEFTVITRLPLVTADGMEAVMLVALQLMGVTVLPLRVIVLFP